MLSFLVPVAGLVLRIIAVPQSRRAGMSNNLATAGIAISTALIVAAVIATIAIWGSGDSFSN